MIFLYALHCAEALVVFQFAMYNGESVFPSTMHPCTVSTTSLLLKSLENECNTGNLKLFENWFEEEKPVELFKR